MSEEPRRAATSRPSGCAGAFPTNQNLRGRGRMFPPPRDARFSLLSRYWWTGAASAMWAGPARLHQWRRTRSRPPARGSMAWRQLRVSGAVGSARGRRVLAGVAGWVGPGTERVPGADRHRRGPG